MPGAKPTDAAGSRIGAGAWFAIWPLAVLAIGLSVFCVVYANWDMLLGDGRVSVQGVDDTGYYIWVRSAVIDGDLDFRNDIEQAPTLAAEVREVWLAAPETAAGRVANKYPCGWAVASLPAFLAGHAWALAAGAEANGWSAPYFVTLWTWHLALGVVGLWWAWLVARRFASGPMAAIAVLALWIASPMIYYHAGRVSMTHGLVFTLVAGTMHLCFRLRDGADAWWRWSAIAGLSALAVLVRSTAAVYLLFPAVVLFTQFRALAARRRWGVACSVAAPVLLVGGIALAASVLVNGTWFAEPYPGESFDFLRPRLLDVLFSPFHGFFYWHPLLLAGVVALGLGAWRGALPRTWVISALVIWYVNASWWMWFFGSSFGLRAFEGVVLFAMAGLAWGLARLPAGRTGRTVAGCVLGSGVGAGAMLLVLFMIQAIPRHGPVSYREMLAAAVALCAGDPGTAPDR